MTVAIPSEGFDERDFQCCSVRKSLVGIRNQVGAIYLLPTLRDSWCRKGNGPVSRMSLANKSHIIGCQSWERR